ncbi:hypothetical protein MEI_00488, partial [Bartonella vinsonii subsp. arupensis Pm136co]
MRTKDVTEILKTLGWEPYRAEDGSMFAHYHLPDRIVGISYDVVDYGEDGGKFLLSANLTTAAYCLAREYSRGIKSEDKYEDTLFYAKEDFDVTAQELSENHIKEALNRVFAWAQAQDIEQKLREEAVNHSLTGKALLGDIEALRNYDSTTKMYVPEFSDYETTMWNERLLLFAQAYKNGELDAVLARKKPKKKLMSLTAASRVFKTQGWFAMDPGKMWLVLPDRFIALNFGLGYLKDNHNVHIESDTSTEAISMACRYIHYDREDKPRSYRTIYRPFHTIGGGVYSGIDNCIDVCVETANEQELIKISERLIQWARAQDLQAAIDSKTLFQEYSYTPDIPWHLACLALTGQIDVLKSYQNTLAMGKIPDHLKNFDEELEDCVNRALEFAEKHLMILKEQEAAEARLSPRALAIFNKISEHLKAMGWTVYRDKNYERNAYLIGKDRLINIVYSLDTKGKSPVVAFKASFSTLGFSTAYRYSFSKMPQYMPLKEAEEVYMLFDAEIDEGKLKQICANIFEWADRQNVNQIIYDYAALPPDSELDLVKYHLVALILIGDIEKLKFYKESFREKNYLGFVKGITKDVIEEVLWTTRCYRAGFPKNAPILSLDPQTTPVEAEKIDEVDETDVDDDRLTMESATALLKSLNWSVKKINEDDHMASYQLADREVDILYNDEIAKDYPQFDSAFLISTGILAAACKVIDPTHSGDLPDLDLNFEAKGLEIFE